MKYMCTVKLQGDHTILKLQGDHIILKLQGDHIFFRLKGNLKGDHTMFKLQGEHTIYEIYLYKTQGDQDTCSVFIFKCLKSLPLLVLATPRLVVVIYFNIMAISSSDMKILRCSVFEMFCIYFK